MKKLRTLLKCNYLYYILLLISLIYVFISINYVNKKSLYDNKETNFNLIIERIRYKNDKYILNLKGKETIIGYYQNEFNYEVGDYINVKGVLEEPSVNTIPNSFNYKDYLSKQSIYYILNVEEVNLIEKNHNLIYKIKNKVINRIENIKVNKDYLYAFILGETYYIDSNIKKDYQYLGVSHLLAIGSTNIMLITFLITYLYKKYKFNDYLYLLIMLIIIFIYIILTDYSVSIIRSGLMFIISYINTKFKFDISYKNILLFLLSLSLILKPYYIFDIGFQYSYLISYMLISFNKLIKGNYITKLLKISLISQFVSFPITILNNYEINIMSILINLIYVPLINFVIFPLTIIVLLIPNLNVILVIIINILESLTIYLSKINTLSFIFKKPDKLLLTIYFILIYLSMYGFKNKKKYLIIPFIITIIIHYNINSIINEDLIVYLDVKQGDSIILKSSNKLALIDTGGNYYKDYSEDIINYIKSIGFKKIDYMILSHGDFDHMGESIDIVNNYNVKNVIFNIGEYNDLEIELIKVLEKNNIYYYSNVKNINLGNYKLLFLYTKKYDNENDNSNVIYLNYNNLKFLFMGDAGINKENDILDTYNLKKIDFLKVGHHGSNTSTSKLFINSINPKYSLISVGKNNRYGHPKDEVLDTLKNSKIYRTDLDGSIEIKLNKNGYKIRTCPP